MHPDKDFLLKLAQGLIPEPSTEEWVGEDRTPAQDAETGCDHVPGFLQPIAGVQAVLAQAVLDPVDHMDLA